MSDYISREAAIKEFSNNGSIFVYGKQQCKAIVSRINSIPAVDVRPVVRGKWKPRDLTWGRSYYYCSACEETVDMPTAMGIPMFRYCPNCGAVMEES